MNKDIDFDHQRVKICLELIFRTMEEMDTQFRNMDREDAQLMITKHGLIMMLSMLRMRNEDSFETSQNEQQYVSMCETIEKYYNKYIMDVYELRQSGYPITLFFVKKELFLIEAIDGVLADMEAIYSLA